MKSFSPFPLVSALLLASSALAQRTTITLGVDPDGVTEWLNGDTIVASLSTDLVNGVTITNTLSRITGPAVTTPTTTPTTTRTRTTATTTDTDDAVTTTDADGRPITTTGPRVVGQQETMPPMQTTTYWYNNGQTWTVATWTASVTAAPTVATYIPPEGTVADYDSYQSQINKQVFASAQAANDNAVASTGAAARRANAPVGGFTAFAGTVIGAVGVGAAIVL